MTGHSSPNNVQGWRRAKVGNNPIPSSGNVLQIGVDIVLVDKQQTEKMPMA